MGKEKYPILQFSSGSSLHRFFFYFLLAANLLSLIYFITLGYYNRLATDDYCYLLGQKDYGFLSPFTFWYQNWQGRFSALFFMNVFLKIHDLIHSLLPETLLLLSLFIWGTSQLLKKMVPVLTTFERVNLSVFIISVFIINNYEFNTFYWLNASAMYFGGVLFLLIGINEILSSKVNFWSYVLLGLSALYAGSSSETFGLICNLVLLIILVKYLIESRGKLSELMSNRRFNKLLVAFIFCSISFLIMYFAPGNAVRLKMTALNAHQIIPLPLHKMIPASIYAFFFFGYSTFVKLPYWILLAFSFLYLGSSLKSKLDIPNIKNFNLALISLCFIAFLWICLLPTVYVQGELGPKRALTHVALYITFFTVFLAFAIGYKRKLNEYRLLWLSIISVFLWGTMLVVYLINDIPEVRKYVQSDEERITYLKSIRNISENDTLLLKPLYVPPGEGVGEQVRGFFQKTLIKAGGKNNQYLSKSLQQHYKHFPIHPNELAKDTNNFVDDCICRVLQLKFHIKLRTDSIQANK